MKTGLLSRGFLRFVQWEGQGYGASGITGREVEWRISNPGSSVGQTRSRWRELPPYAEAKSERNGPGRDSPGHARPGQNSRAE